MKKFSGNSFCRRRGLFMRSKREKRDLKVKAHPWNRVCSSPDDEVLVLLFLPRNFYNFFSLFQSERQSQSFVSSRNSKLCHFADRRRGLLIVRGVIPWTSSNPCLERVLFINTTVSCLVLKNCLFLPGVWCKKFPPN